MTRLFILLAVLMTALLLAGGDLRPDAVAAGAVYYVAPNGNDANPGTLARPWRTIQHAAATLTAGDTVYIRAGTYSERVVPLRSGSAGQVITYAAYPGETATIDGTGVAVPEWEGLFHIVNKAYLRVSGLRVLNAGSNPHNPGILVDGSSYIVIENNFVSHTNDSGIGVWGSDHVVVTRNEVEQACLGGFNESISVGGTDVFEVSYNRVHDGPKEGIDLKDGSSNGKVFGNEVYSTQAVGLYVDAWDKHTYNIEVYQNVVHDIAAMGFAIASEMGGLLENVRLYNNIAYHNRHVGIWLSGCCPESPTHPVRGIAIINNTLHNNGWQDWGGGIGIENTQVQTVTIRNNICSQNTYSQMAADPDVLPELTVDHNLTDGDRDPEFEFSGADDLIGVSPSFVNPSTADYHLQPGSPAIDHGSAVAAPDADFAGHSRPQDGDGDGAAGYDIGAYEFRPPARRLYLPLIVKA
ncbi:MAG: right-handed parallel beta-helix repeat-containing protein [Anaerolineae bacterium]|nr:right-handed parallel beta-helix repeat-containing protein [Anaerolineae bacterium]